MRWRASAAVRPGRTSFWRAILIWATECGPRSGPSRSAAGTISSTPTMIRRPCGPGSWGTIPTCRAATRGWSSGTGSVMRAGSSTSTWSISTRWPPTTSFPARARTAWPTRAGSTRFTRRSVHHPRSLSISPMRRGRR